MAENPAVENSAEMRPDGILVIRYVGPQTKQSLLDLGVVTERLARPRREKRLPVLVLVDASKITRIDWQAREVASDLLGQDDVERVVILGVPSYLRIPAKMLVQASGRANHVRFMTDEAAAIRWILEAS